MDCRDNEILGQYFMFGGYFWGDKVSRPVFVDQKNVLIRFGYKLPLNNNSARLLLFIARPFYFPPTLNA